MIEHYYLVDMENVFLRGLQGMNLPGENSEIRLFISNAMHTGNEKVKDGILNSKAKINSFFCSASTKNAMDFEIAAYCGAALSRPSTKRISLISRDKGFLALADYVEKARPDVTFYQGETIFEAYVVSETNLTPKSYEGGKR